MLSPQNRAAFTPVSIIELVDHNPCSCCKLIAFHPSKNASYFFDHLGLLFSGKDVLDYLDFNKWHQRLLITPQMR